MKRKILFKIGIAFGIIIFFICVSAIQSTSTKIVSKSNTQTFSENSTICGYVTNFETGEPVFEAELDFFINDDQGTHYDYYTISDENGYYIIENVVTGTCIENGANADGYHFFWGTGEFEVPENATVWLNISMYPRQPETSKICGYIKDNLTGKCINNATIYTMWWDIHGQLTYNGTSSKENGFYTINIGAGFVWVDTATEAYINKMFSVDGLGDNERVWCNFSLDPEVTIDIKPKNGFYFKNKMIFPFYFPIIIGSVDIEINVTLYGGGPIDYVEILIDGISKYNFTSEPCVYHWDDITFFKIRHKIEVIVYRVEDSDIFMVLEVLKFF